MRMDLGGSLKCSLRDGWKVGILGWRWNVWRCRMHDSTRFLALLVISRTKVSYGPWPFVYILSLTVSKMPN